MSELPPETASLAKKLRAAMKREGYESARSLGLAIGLSNGSHVTKWLNGSVKEVKSERHLTALTRVLGTPEDYFRETRTRSDRLAEVEETAVTTKELDRTVGSLTVVLEKNDRVLALHAAAIRFLASGKRREALRALSDADAL